MRIGIWQSGLHGHDPVVHADVVRRGADQTVDLLVFPECYFGGMPKTREQAHAQSLRAPYQPLMDAFTGTGPTMTVVAGFVEQAPTGHLYSSAAIIRAGQMIAVARKLFPIEPVFSPGDTLSTHAASDVRFGVVICYDGNFIEPARLLAHAGARLLVCPLNNDLRREVTPEWVIRTRSNLIARAVENDCWVIAADVSGQTSTRVGLAASAIIRPDGHVVAQSDPRHEHLLVADIEIAARTRLHQWDVRRNPAVFQLWRQAHSGGSAGLS